MTTKRIKLKADTTKIFARSLKTGEEVEIDDLYWFEENSIRDFSDSGYENWEFELEIEESDRT